MDALEKRDLLGLAGDPFIKSILAPKGNLPYMDHKYYRGNILVLPDHQI